MMLALALFAVLNGDTNKVALQKLATDSPSSLGQSLEVCGTFVVQPGQGHDEPSPLYLLENRGGEDAWAIYVDRKVAGFGPDQAHGCVKGKFRRVDGLSAEDARRSGNTLLVVHGINSQYMLYPLD